jgi:DNA-binding response OmpR family regulator
MLQSNSGAGIKIGAYDYIQKLFEPEELMLIGRGNEFRL